LHWLDSHSLPSQEYILNEFFFGNGTIETHVHQSQRLSEIMQTANGSLEAVTGRKLIKKFLKRTSI
jgi:hypothetical protein